MTTTERLTRCPRQDRAKWTWVEISPNLDLKDASFLLPVEVFARLDGDSWSGRGSAKRIAAYYTTYDDAMLALERACRPMPATVV